jgi:hypothetical protein
MIVDFSRLIFSCVCSHGHDCCHYYLLKILHWVESLIVTLNLKDWSKFHVAVPQQLIFHEEPNKNPGGYPHLCPKRSVDATAAGVLKSSSGSGLLKSAAGSAKIAVQVKNWGQDMGDEASK